MTEREVEAEGDAVVLRRLSEGLAASRSVEAAVVLALDAVVDGSGRPDLSKTEVYVPNEFLAAETRRHPNLLFGAGVNPHRRDALERLDAAAEAGAVLLKWLPPVQGIDPADPGLEPFYRKLADLGLPLLIHTGNEHSFTRSRHELGDPARLERALAAGVTVIAAHAGASGSADGEPNLPRLLRLLPRYPNLFPEVSSLTQLNKVAALPRLLASPVARDRLVYGSDMPLIATAAVSPLYFVHRLGLGRALALRRVPNPWDRDVALKKALGVPDEAFRRGATLLRRVGPTLHRPEART